MKKTQVAKKVRALSTLRGLRGAPEVPPLCLETQSLGQQMLNAPVGINGLSIISTLDICIYIYKYYDTQGPNGVHRSINYAYGRKKLKPLEYDGTMFTEVFKGVPYLKPFIHI